jgi:hypothetical protein
VLPFSLVFSPNHFILAPLRPICSSSQQSERVGLGALDGNVSSLGTEQTQILYIIDQRYMQVITRIDSSCQTSLASVKMSAQTWFELHYRWGPQLPSTVCYRGTKVLVTEFIKCPSPVFLTMSALHVVQQSLFQVHVHQQTGKHMWMSSIISC